MHAPKLIVAAGCLGLCVAMTGTCGAEGSSPYPASLDAGCIAYYGFDGDDPGGDMTGNGWDGLSAGVDFVTGVVGRAAAFNGTGGIIVDAFRNLAWGEEFSISLWYNRPSAAGPGYLPLVGNGVDEDASWSITCGGENGGRVIWAMVETSPVTRSPDFTPSPAELDIWHHVVLIYTRGRAAIFVDGAAQLALQEERGAIHVMDQPLQIACVKVQGQWRRSKILVDEVRLYNRALSGEEINQLGANVLASSSVPAGERPAIRKVSPNILPGSSAAPAGHMPGQAPAIAPQTPSVAPPAVTPREPSPQGGAMVTPATAPRGKVGGPAAAEPPPATWWTDEQASGVSTTSDCCVVYQTWIELWRQGQKQAVIDDLNRLSGP